MCGGFVMKFRARNNKDGVTLIELIVVMFIIGLLFSIAVPNAQAIYQRTILRNSAHELESALQMARQLSMDESKSYEVFLSKDRFSIRESIAFGQRIHIWDLPQGVERAEKSDLRISFNRRGVTNYGKFTLRNRDDRIDIEIHIGSGRIVISDVY